MSRCRNKQGPLIMYVIRGWYVEPFNRVKSLCGGLTIPSPAYRDTKPSKSLQHIPNTLLVLLWALIQSKPYATVPIFLHELLDISQHAPLIRRSKFGQSLMTSSSTWTRPWPVISDGYGIAHSVLILATLSLVSCSWCNWFSINY